MFLHCFEDMRLRKAVFIEDSAFFGIFYRLLVFSDRNSFVSGVVLSAR